MIDVKNVQKFPPHKITTILTHPFNRLHLPYGISITNYLWFFKYRHDENFVSREKHDFNVRLH